MSSVVVYGYLYSGEDIENLRLTITSQFHALKELVNRKGESSEPDSSEPNESDDEHEDASEEEVAEEEEDIEEMEDSDEGEEGGSVGVDADEDADAELSEASEDRECMINPQWSLADEIYAIKNDIEESIWWNAVILPTYPEAFVKMSGRKILLGVKVMKPRTKRAIKVIDFDSPPTVPPEFILNETTEPYYYTCLV